MRTIEVGHCTLILGDAVDFVRTKPSVGALVSDPPYGIAFDYARKRSRRSGLVFGSEKVSVDRDRGWQNILGDDRPFDPTPFLDFPEVILWGANNYAHLLPPSRGWLIWDKLGNKAPSHYGDAEIAWTNKDMVVRIHRQTWRGIVRSGEENVSNGPKLHPAQKPVDLMTWCLGFIKSDCVLDPFMGSGSTAIACMRSGKRFIGVEKVRDHFETAVRRVRFEAAFPGKPYKIGSVA